MLTLTINAADLRVTAIDVGQGDSICVETPGGKTVLIDAGDTFAGSKVVNFLKSRKVENIQLMVLTHQHQDHYGGMPAVINAYTVNNFWDNNFYKSTTQSLASLKTLISDRKIAAENIIAGKSVDIGSAHFTVLAPSVADTTNANNNSIIIRITYGARSFLLMGDAEIEERKTVSNWMTCDVLKVSHHGSANGTDKQFINTIKPVAAVISYGANNIYGHPDSSVLSDLIPAYVAKTAIDGSVTYITDGKTLSVYKHGVTSVPTQSDSNGNVIDTDGSDITVYVTRYGARYHQKTCRYAKISYPISLKDAVEQGYQACKVCKP